MRTIRKLGFLPVRFASAASFALADASCSVCRNAGSRLGATSTVGEVIGSCATTQCSPSVVQDVDSRLRALERFAQRGELFLGREEAGLVERGGGRGAS